MTQLEQRILDKVRATLDEERLASAIVYLERNPIPAGKRVRVGNVFIDMPWDGYIAFIDLEPGVNWGHACCYLAIRPDTDEVIQVAARMPPFLKGEVSTFRLLWRGPLAPKWVVAENAD